MANWHGYLLITQPSEISTGDWNTILAYLDNSGVLNEAPSSSQPAERWHVTESSNKYIIESTFEDTELTKAGLAQHYSDALGGTPNPATMETYLDDGAGDIHWQVFALGEYIGASREAARHHLNVYGFTCRGSRLTAGDTYYVATTGSASNDGSIGSPWTLAHVLSGDAGVLQKDTIFLRGGNYGTMPLVLISGYSDSEVDEPIYLRGYGPDWIAGNYPIIQGGESVNAPDVTFWNIVFTGAVSERYTDEPGSAPEGYDTSSGITLFAPNTKLINCIIHDTNGNGVGNWEPAPNAICYGTLMFNNGWDSDDVRSSPLYDGAGNRTSERYAHGHNQYTQNISGVKDTKHSLFLPSFGFTYSAHSASGNAGLNGVEFRECLFYSFRAEIGWIGSPAVINGALVDNCVIWDVNFAVGQSVDGGDADITNNLIFDRIRLARLADGTFTDNVMVQTGDYYTLTYTHPQEQAVFPFDNNTYYTLLRDAADDIIQTGGDGSGNPNYTASEWQATGRDPSSTFNLESEPTGSTVKVWVNDYKDADDPRVGIFIIANWDEASSVNVDLSTLGMVNTQDYKFFNAFDYFGDTPINHTSDGDDSSVAITTTGWSMAVPAGTHNGNVMLEPIDPIPDKLRVFIVEEA